MQGLGFWAVPLSPFWNAFPTHSILTLDAFRLYHLHNGSYTDCIPALLHIRKASSGHGLHLFRALTIHTDKITWRNFLHYSFKHLSQNIKQKRFLHPSKMWGLILKFSQSFFKFLICFFLCFSRRRGNTCSNLLKHLKAYMEIKYMRQNSNKLPEGQ